MQDWLAGCWYDLMACVAASASILGFSLRVEGGRNIPRQGPALLVANHQCYLDPVFIGLTMCRRLCFLARKNLWKHRGLAWFLDSINAYPVDQEGVATEGIRSVIRLLEKGQAVLVFPEGSRTWNGQMEPLKPGVHLIIRRALPPIVPIGIAGAYDAWPRWRSYPTPAPLFLPPGKGTVAVSVGRPINSKRFAEMPREAALAELHREIQQMAEHAARLRRK
jgi:1-acyl-sn-glycerol-3-phosphate acyltransferase